MEWTQGTVEQLFNSVEENQHLEFKSGEFFKDDFTNSLTKFVTGFANSDGGTLLVGVKEGEKNEKIYATDFWTFDGRKWNREKIEAIIDQHISPRISGIRIHPIRLENDVSKSVYAIEIPKSDTCHQASDNRYYFRLDTSTRPMKDFQIRDVMGRRKYTDLRLSIKLQNSMHIDVGILNKGSVLCRNWTLTFLIPTSALQIAYDHSNAAITPNSSYIGIRKANIDFGAISSPLKDLIAEQSCHIFHENRLRLDRGEAIFPRTRLEVINIHAESVRKEHLVIYWQIDSDDGRRSYGMLSPYINEVHRQDSFDTDDVAYVEG